MFVSKQFFLKDGSVSLDKHCNKGRNEGEGCTDHQCNGDGFDVPRPHLAVPQFHHSMLALFAEGAAWLHVKVCTRPLVHLPGISGQPARRPRGFAYPTETLALTVSTHSAQVIKVGLSDNKLCNVFK